MPSNPNLAQWISSALIAAIALAASPCWAEITPTGDVSPADPATWTSTTNAIIGNTADGSLVVNAGSTLLSSLSYLGYNVDVTGSVTLDNATWTTNDSLNVGFNGTGTLLVTDGGHLISGFHLNHYIGFNPGAIGIVTIDGANSSWDNKAGYLEVGYFGTGALNITNGVHFSCSYKVALGDRLGGIGTVTVDGTSSTCTLGDLYVGLSGTGTLNITNGAVVTAGSTNVAVASTATGAINFGPHGGTLTTISLHAAPTQFTGTGTIKTNGLVSDVNLVFDATHGTNQSWIWNNAGQSNLNVNLDLRPNGDLGAGYLGTGNLAIRDGVAVQSMYGFLGYQTVATGMATIDGPGSLWQCGQLAVGYGGTGTLNVVKGGTVACPGLAFIGQLAGSAGIVTVDGSTFAASFLTVGGQGTGTLTVTNGGKVTSASGNIGALGMATVDGANSTWTLSGSLSLGPSAGNAGTALLNITNGGIVTVGGATYARDASASTGSINFGANGGTLTTQSLYAASPQFTGSGTIMTRGIVSDNDLAFDATHGLIQTLTWEGAQQHVTLQLDLTGKSGAVVVLGAGYQGTATLTIRDGLSVTSVGGYLGYNGGATGTATVDGLGSNWSNSGSLTVGYSGTGTLTLTQGGKVSTISAGYLGYNQGATGTVTVDGPGSIWSNSGSLTVGCSGTGTLNITNGALVTVGGPTYIALGLYFSSAAVGSINFGANGGTLTTQSLYASSPQITGSGTILTRGIVSDDDLAFDATQGLNRTLTWDGAQQHVTLQLDLTGKSGAVGDLGAGYQGAGTLTIRDGLSIASLGGYLGYKKGAAGTAIVDGIGSSWTNTKPLYVGNAGDGTLTITHGGKVSSISDGFLSYSGGAGTVSVDGFRSTWSISGSLTIGFTGTATLTLTQGAAANAASATLGYYPGATGTMMVDGSTWSSSGGLTLGYLGTGALILTHGAKANSTSAILGAGSATMYMAGGAVNVAGAGIATVDGLGSTWSNSGSLTLGFEGTGALHITNGGLVSSSSGYLGEDAGATGTVTVDGSGSLWTNKANLNVGVSGIGILSITCGGKVTALNSSMNSQSLLALTAGDGSTFDCGAGSLTNNGTIRLKAIPNLAPGTYNPIKAATWSGTGTVQALGGIWNTASHSFTVSPAASGTAGLPVTIDPSQTQRITITDPATSQTLHANFLPTSAPSSLTFTASLLTYDQSAFLDATLPPNALCLSAWTFSAAPYTTGTPVFLSLAIGPNLDPATLALYHFDGTAWSPYSAADLSYDGTFANFTVTSFSGYAVTTTPVPEPAALCLLALGGMPLLLRCRVGTFRRS